jgi:hypothetical protein
MDHGLEVQWEYITKMENLVMKMFNDLKWFTFHFSGGVRALNSVVSVY